MNARAGFQVGSGAAANRDASTTKCFSLSQEWQFMGWAHVQSQLLKSDKKEDLVVAKRLQQ